MQPQVVEEKTPHADSRKAVTVNVNNHPVKFQDHKATGLEIKQTAIQQGVAIQEGFNLFLVKKSGKLQPISDQETVTLHPKDEFRATAPDDNS